MPSEHSIHRLARLAKKVTDDLRRGGMAINFRMMFRSTATLSRVVSVLAEQVARLSEEVEKLRSQANAQASAPSSAARSGGARSPSRTRSVSDGVD